MTEPMQDFQVRDWVVRTQRLCMERGSEVVHVKPKSMAVLECLAKADRAVVSRNELFDRVWPGATVSDDVLTQSVVELRKAFGDTARDARFIETIPRRGFRLIPEVTAPKETSVNVETPLRPGSASGGRRRPAFAPYKGLGLGLGALLLIALLVYMAVPNTRQPVLTIEDPPTLVVLPFVDMSPAGDQQYFADGLAEEVRNGLARLKGLQVIGRASAYSLHDSKLALSDIAEALQVGHVVEGSVRRFSDRIRVTAQLVDAVNGIVLWSEKYDRDLQDIFAVQDEIARSIATALSIKLDVGDISGLAGSTDNVEAYNEVLKGQASYRQYTPESVLDGIDHFRRAIDLDPEYAMAWERLADIYTTGRHILSAAQMGGDWQALSAQALERAMRLAPDSPEVLGTKAFRQVHLQQWVEAERTQAQRAVLLEAKGSYTDALDSLLILVGRLQEAEQVLEDRRRLDPRSGIVSFYLSNVYTDTGQLDAALQEMERGYQLGSYRSLVVLRGWITALIAGDRALLQRWLKLGWESYPQRKELDSIMLELLDDSPTALQWLRENYPNPAVEVSWFLTWAAYHGDDDFALELLRDLGEVSWSYWSPLLAGVRRREEFKQLVIERGLLDYWREFAWGDYCRPVGDADFECF